MKEPTDLLSDLSGRISRTVSALEQWQNLHYIGFFIDLDPTQKSVVDQLAKRANEVLATWNITVPRSRQSGSDSVETAAGPEPTKGP